MRQGFFTVPDRAGVKPKLIGGKCSNCGLVTFPKKLACPRCSSADGIKEILLNGEGRIDSFALVRVDLPNMKAPYILADVKLAEGPIVTTQIIGREPSETAVKIGDRVELALIKVAEDEQGNDLLDYRFRPVKR